VKPACFGHGCHFPTVELGCDYGDYERAKELLRLCQGSTKDYSRIVGELGAPLQISTAFASWQLQRYTARHSSSGRQANFAALIRGRHLYSAGRPSRWALAHILVYFINCNWR